MALSAFNLVSLGLPSPTRLTLSSCLFFLLTSGSTSYPFSLKASYPKCSVVVEMFCQGWPLGRWGRTFGVLVRLIIRGDELQSHFILIAERRAWALNVLLLGQLFSAAWRCVRDFICPVEEWVVNLEKGQKTRTFLNSYFFFMLNQHAHNNNADMLLFTRWMFTMFTDVV